MKKTFTVKSILIVFICLISFCVKSNATIHTVSVANFSFNPVTLTNVIVGDTVKWVWVSGIHTTTSTSVPAGAAVWDEDINSTDSTFQYKVTVAGVYDYVCTPHVPNMAASFTASAVLPVRLSEFKIANENNKAVLKWITASEENIDYFSVQKSKTGSDFVEIAKVPAAGNSSVLKSYTYTDPDFTSSDKYCYYTIAIVDKEGKKQFSPVELFRNKLNVPNIIISLSPNPIDRSGHLMMKFNADKASEMHVRITNMQGMAVKETTMHATEGVNNGHLMLGPISAGSYIINVELNGIKEVHRLIVR